MIDVFKVGVHIGMTSNAPQALSVMLAQLTGLHIAASKLQNSLGLVKQAAIGAGMAFAGWEALKMMERLTEKGIEFNQQLVQMRMANYSVPDIATLERQSYDTMKDVPGSDLTENIRNLIDLRNISGSSEHAAELSDLIAKTNLVLSNITHAPAGQAGYKFMKFLEDSGRMSDPITGQFSAERVAQEAHWMQGVIAGMNGKVTGDDLFQLRQSGKSSVNVLSDLGLNNLLPLIQSLGAVQVGSALSGGQQQLLGGVQLRDATVNWLEKYNLLDPKKVHHRGQNYTLDPGALTGEGEFRTDRVGWIWDVLEKQMQLKGLTKEQMVQEIGRSGLRLPLSGMIAEVIQNEGTFRKEIGNVNQAQGVDQYAVMDANSPTFRITKFSEAWDNLQKALGKTVDVTQFLVPLTDALNYLDAMAVSHPEAAKDLILLAGGISSLVTLSGSIMVFNIALSPLVSGIRMLTAVSAASAATAGTGLTSLAGGINALLLVLTGAGFYELLHNILPSVFGTDFHNAQGGHGNGHSPNSSGHGVPYVPGGSGHGGGPVDPNFHRESMVGPPPINLPIIQTSATFNVDGREMSKVVSREQARAWSGPQSGSTRFDGRMSPSWPGDTVPL